MHILIADDDNVSNFLLTIMLKNLGHTVVSAINGEDLVKKFKENVDIFDLVITDLRMPHMNGEEAAVCIKAIKNIPIIASSASEIEISDIKIFDEYIAKPIKQDHIRNILEKVMK